MFSENLKRIRNLRGLSLQELSNLTEISKSYINNLERNSRSNPSMEVINKLAIALKCDKNDLIYEEQLTDSDLDELDKKYSNMKREVDLFEIKEFDNKKDALDFIYNQPAILGYNGFDTDKLTDREIINFANELLNQMRLLTYKYKK